MSETQYGIVEHEASALPTINLLRVPYRNSSLVVNHPAFGPNTYANNLAAMQKTSFHSQAIPEATFRELTTAESIAVSSYDFPNLAKPQIFDPQWLQAGRIVRMPKGVAANPPRDTEGNAIIDGKEIKALIDKAKKIKVGRGHIYLGENDFGFADYDSFQRGVQDCDTFAEGGLARILEHSESTAQNLRTIASPKNYKRGVKVYAFDPVNEPIEKVVGLGSVRILRGSRLNVVGFDRFGYNHCFAFGGVVSGEAIAQTNL